MPTYVTLLNWTELGLKNVKDTVKRAEAASQRFEQLGGRMTNILWTEGPYDAIVISEWPDDETASAALLTVARDGNVRTQTLRAFTGREMERIINKIP